MSGQTGKLYYLPSAGRLVLPQRHSENPGSRASSALRWLCVVGGVLFACLLFLFVLEEITQSLTSLAFSASALPQH